MRDPGLKQRAQQIALALLLLAPLFAAFWAGGGLEVSTDPAYKDFPPQELATIGRYKFATMCLLSLYVGLLSTHVALCIGVPAAWFLAQKRGRLGFVALAVLPLALPAPVAVSGWVQLMAPDAASSFALPVPGIVSELRAELFSRFGAGSLLGFGLWPIVTLFCWSAFARARDTSYEAALLSVSPLRAFGGAVLPRCYREIFAGAALVFLIACSDFAVCSLLLQKTLAVEVHDRIALGKHATAAWASLPLVALAGLLCFFIAPRSKHAPVQTPAAAQALGRDLFSAGFFWIGIALGFAVPMLACLRGGWNSGKPLSVAFHAGAGALALSARLAAAAALIGCAAACVRLLLWPDQRAGAVNTAGIFLLAIPGAFLAAALLILQINLSGFNLPLLGWLAFGFALRFAYVPFRLAEAGLEGIDSALLESAALLGQNRFARACSIALPLTAGHLAAAAALVFVLALGEVAIAAVLAPPGATPATIWLFNQQHMGYDESVFALSLGLGAVAAGTVAVGALAAKWAVK